MTLCKDIPGWERAAIIFAVAVAFSAYVSVAFAGNYGENVGIGSGGPGDATANMDRAMRPGGGWNNWCCGQIPNIGTVPGSSTGFWGRLFSSFYTDVSASPQQQISYMQSGPASNGLGQMEPDSRGSGVTGGSIW